MQCQHERAQGRIVTELKAHSSGCRTERRPSKANKGIQEVNLISAFPISIFFVGDGDSKKSEKMFVLYYVRVVKHTLKEILQQHTTLHR